MPDQIFPITFKPGIRKDLPVSQNVYCTNAKWTRFYQGMPQSMGGLYYYDINNILPNFLNNDYTHYRVTNIEKNIVILWSENATGKNTNNPPFLPANSQINFLKIGNDQDINAITRYQPNLQNNFPNLNNAAIIKGFAMVRPNCYLMWYIQGVNSHMAIYILDGNNSTLVEVNGDIPNKKITAVCISSNVIFFSEGVTLWWFNLAGDVFNADFGLVSVLANQANSDQKNTTDYEILKILEVRGGNISPTLLVWTTNSLVRFSNSGERIDQDNTFSYRFRKETITNDSSILGNNPNVIVEYEGIFYWIGENKFYFYNGVVLTLENTISKQYFFDNLDRSQVNKIYCFKNEKYNEICWVYPTINKAGLPETDRGRGTPLEMCNRILIYNVSDDCWYDTDFCSYSGSNEYFVAGLYNQDARPTFNNARLGKFTNLNDGQTDLNEANIPDQVNMITSFFTTPLYSFRLNNGLDKLIKIKRIEPNFYITERANSVTTVEIKAYRTLNTTSLNRDTSNALTINADNDIIDYFIEGRYITYTFKHTGFGYKMGQSLFTCTYGDSN